MGGCVGRYWERWDDTQSRGSSRNGGRGGKSTISGLQHIPNEKCNDDHLWLCFSFCIALNYCVVEHLMLTKCMHHRENVLFRISLWFIHIQLYFSSQLQLIYLMMLWVEHEALSLPICGEIRHTFVPCWKPSYLFLFYSMGRLRAQRDKVFESRNLELVIPYRQPYSFFFFFLGDNV